MSRRWIVLLGLVGVGYVVFLAWFHSPYAGGSDSSGYLNSARLLLHGKFSTPVRIPAGMPADLLPPHAFMPLGFRLDSTGSALTPTYPVGLPLHFVALGWLTGLGPASTVIAIASALAFAALLYATGREFGVSAATSAGVAVVAALSPLTLFYALQPMSDLLAAVWTLAAVLCALRAARDLRWAVAAGAAFAVAVLVRPTNLLLILPLAFALPFRLRPWLAFVGGGLPGAVFLGFYNSQLYGAVLTTGYGDVSSLFSASYFLPSLANYARGLPLVATPLLAAALALPWLAVSTRHRLLLASWAVAFLIFYAAYEPAHENWQALRFVFPALPPLAVAAALALDRAQFLRWALDLQIRLRLLRAPASSEPTSTIPSLRVSLALLVLGAAVAWQIGWARALRISHVEREERVYHLLPAWLDTHLPDDAVLVVNQVSGALIYHTDRAFISHFRITPDENARLTAWLEREERPLYAVLFAYEEAGAQERLPGTWQKIASLRQATLWQRLSP